MENSLSCESESKPKRMRKPIPTELLCKGKKSNGEPCSFAHMKNSMYCKHHEPKVSMMDAGTNTCNELIELTDASFNTEENMLDIATANRVILELIDDKVESKRAMAELIDLYNLLRSELENLQSL